MTVREFIEELKDLNPDQEIWIKDKDGDIVPATLGFNWSYDVYTVRPE